MRAGDHFQGLIDRMKTKTELLSRYITQEFLTLYDSSAKRVKGAKLREIITNVKQDYMRINGVPLENLSNRFVSKRITDII